MDANTLATLKTVEEALGYNLNWLADNLDPIIRMGGKQARDEASKRLAQLDTAWRATAIAIAKAEGKG